MDTCDDSASAYEYHADTFIDTRSPTIGAATVEQWACSLAPASEVLEIACGAGVPVSQTLLRAGLNLWVIDSSPALLAAFSQRFPTIPVQCARVQDTEFFNRQFDAIIAIGLVFLLNEQDQIKLIQRVSGLLPPCGRWLFTAPVQSGSWNDPTTGHHCLSLGEKSYVELLQAAGFQDAARFVDEGGNHYYSAKRIGSQQVC